MYNKESKKRFETSEKVDAESELEIPEGTRDVPANNESEEENTNTKELVAFLFLYAYNNIFSY